MTFSTTYDLIQEAKRQEPLGRSGYVTVAEFPNGLLPDHVIQTHSMFPLQTTTVLTPVDYAIRQNFGQPVLLHSAKVFYPANPPIPQHVPVAVGVLPKIRGTDIWKRILDETDRLRPLMNEMEQDKRGILLLAEANVLETLAALPDYSFVRWMHGRQQQIQHGAGGDNSLANVMVHDQVLSDIDVVHHESKYWNRNNVEDISGMFSTDMPGQLASRHYPLYERQRAASDTIIHKITQAAKETGVPRDRLFFAGRIPPHFKKTELTGLFGAFPLSEAPEKLVTLLKEMAERYPIR